MYALYFEKSTKILHITRVDDISFPLDRHIKLITLDKSHYLEVIACMVDMRKPKYVSQNLMHCYLHEVTHDCCVSDTEKEPKKNT